MLIYSKNKITICRPILGEYKNIFIAALFTSDIVFLVSMGLSNNM